MKRKPLSIGVDPITRLNGLLKTIYNSPTINENDRKQAFFEIGECLVSLKKEIEELKSNQEK